MSAPGAALADRVPDSQAGGFAAAAPAGPPSAVPPPFPFGPPESCPCPPAASLEGEACATDGYLDNFNGGCNSEPPVFTAITDGETVCGEASTFTVVGVGNFRDTDWYGPIVIAEMRRLRWTVRANFEAQLFLFHEQAPLSPCEAENLGGVMTVVDCDAAAVLTATVPPGTYYAYVSPTTFGDGADCGVAGTSYVATLDLLEPVLPDPCPCPLEATSEGEECAGDGFTNVLNAGCNAFPATFTPVENGEVICGEVSTYRDPLGQNARDTDWFGPIVVSRESTLAWTTEANLAAEVFIVEDRNPKGFPCLDSNQLILRASGVVSPDCKSTVVSARVVPGRYYAVVAPPTFGSGADCGLDGTHYVARLDLGDPCDEPVADFTAEPTAGPAPLAVTLTNLSTGSEPLTHGWDFGDGQVSNERNPVHVFSQPGSFLVTLTVTNLCGEDVAEIVNRIDVSVPCPPPADFTCGEGDAIALAWTNADAYDAIAVLRDGTLIATLPGDIASFIDPSPPPGFHIYRLVAACPEGGESSSSECLTLTPPAPDFIRGDADGDGAFNGLIDALWILAFQFQSGPAPPCLESADANGDGVFNGLVDGLYVLAHQFQFGPPPAEPHPVCGADPAVRTSLGCLASRSCN